jgi:heavy metal translocating P-type ATPase
MFSILSNLATGGSAVPGKPRKKAEMILKLTNQPEVGIVQQVKNDLQALGKVVAHQVTTTLVNADEHYQSFVQNHIDPLLGKTRQSQMQEMLQEAALTLSPEERFVNQRLALATLALGSAVVGRLLFAPFMAVAIVLGLSAMWINYYFAYLQWQQTRRLGAIHLLCIYLAFLWLGGYAIIGAFGALLMGIGLKIKVITENQSRNHLIQIFNLQPATVWVRTGGMEVEIPFAQLQVGDTLVLSAGQIVPVDGTIIVGDATVDQHNLTGEAQPVEKGVGDPLLASTLLVTGKVDLQVEKTGADTTAGQIGTILNQTAQRNTEMGLKVLALTDQFALPTVALSVVSWPFIGPAGAMSLLGANCTITTYMSGTLAMLNFLNIAAEGGILVKDGFALEHLNSVDTIVFDKTGTLTVEQPQVAQIHILNSLSATEVLTLAAAAEARQSHPIARAILTAAAGLTLPAIAEAHYEVGFGIKVRLVWGEEQKTEEQKTEDREIEESGEERGVLVRVGSARFMALEGVEVPAAVEPVMAASQAQGHSLVMVALGEQLVGCIELQPTVRPEAQRIVEGLRERGLALYIISGDHEAPTSKLALSLGMTGYFANVLPDQKATLVEELQQQGRKVCFIGDGINDAIAMRKAYVSISLRGATTVATDTAQIILMEGNLNQLLHLFALSERFAGNLKTNLRLSGALSLLAMGGVLFAGFSFAATEIVYTVSLLGGLGIAMQPLLNYRRQARAREATVVEATATPRLIGRSIDP